MRRVLPLALALSCALPLPAQPQSLPTAGSAPLPSSAAEGTAGPRRLPLDHSHAAALTARYHVRQMENVLERAVQHAADVMSRRLQAMSPDVMALAGAPRAQGFRIDGYGLFFSVEVPRLSESVNWALRVLSQDRDERVLTSLQKLARSEQDAAVRADLERAMRAVQLQLAPAGLPAGTPAAAARRPATPGPPPTSSPGAEAGSATAVDDEASASRGAVTNAPETMADPSAVYEDEVKGALVDAVLDYAGSLPMMPTEWVTVAARDAGYMAFPDAVSDMVTVTLSVRVSDLADFRAQRLTRDQARARVVMREF